MVIAVSSEIAKQSRSTGKGRSGGFPRWRTEYVGRRAEGTVGNDPQAFLTELEPRAVIEAHFHQVDQFQVMVAGTGTLGRHGASALAVHYADRHTGYGPIKAGDYGLSFFTIRAQSDTGSTLISAPNARDFLKPSKQRYLMAEHIALSTEPVLRIRQEAAFENLLGDIDASDGLGAAMVRLGANMQATGPEPTQTGGQFCLIVNGTLIYDDAAYPAWSTLFAGRADAALELRAGPDGLEALILSFPCAQPSIAQPDQVRN